MLRNGKTTIAVVEAVVAAVKGKRVTQYVAPEGSAVIMPLEKYQELMALPRNRGRRDRVITILDEAADL